ncbi:MAG TPA: ATP-binding protein [Thermoanaerobaculia bacterium]|nr:ATP-binding protein [Thermoanaerobaculia bacterium]
MGLAICHGIIEQHEGEIHLESEAGEGTTASVRLPLIQGETWPIS